MKESSFGGRVAVLGRPGAPITGYFLQSLLDHGISVEAVIFDSKVESAKNLQIWADRTAGRLPEMDLQKFLASGTRFIDVESHNSEATKSIVRELGLDILINGGTPRILEAYILESPRLGVLNVHPGLLPKFRGATCVEWAIYLDEHVGNTAHFMTPGIDEGPIIFEEVCPVSPGDSYVDIRVAVYERGFELMARAASKVLRDQISERDLMPQPGGMFFKPIEADKMAEVFRKLSEGQYRPDGWRTEAGSSRTKSTLFPPQR